MRDEAYHELGSHKADHERLLDDLCDMMQAFEHSEEVDRVELAQRLDAWFSHHFRTYDARFHREFGAHPQ